MSRQIIRQANGLYCVFSSIVDSLIIWNAKPEDIIKFMVDDYTEEVTEMVNSIVEKLESGEKPVNRTMTLSELKERIKDVHGSKKLKKYKGVFDEQ